MASSTTEPGSAAPPTSPQAGAAADPVRIWRLFAVTWAAAVLFHFAGNPRLAPEWGRGLAGVAALAVLVAPKRPWLGVPLAIAVLANVWLEAPTLGNHWLLHGLLALVVLGALIVGRARVEPVVRRLVPAARLLLLAFYCFAAFAKLNADFFDPAVSCAVFYLRESADSWGALGLYDALPDAADSIVAILVAAIELSVPLLLVVRRTRHVGVVVAIAFHWVLAVDRSHQFFDFSSLLTVLFLLFLDPAAQTSLVRRWERLSGAVARRWESGPELVRLLGLAGAAAAVVAFAAPDRIATVGPLREVGVFVWMALGLLVLAMVVAVVRDEPRAAEPLADLGAAGWLLVIPAVAVLNGLTPYLELKSGFGWNMYANLAVVDGDSNHYVVRAGLPLGSGHARLVSIVSTTDPGLEPYIGAWLLPEMQLEDHLADRPGVRVIGEVDGERVVYLGGATEARPYWQRKLVLYRAVDADGAIDCQPVFGPAR